MCEKGLANNAQKTVKIRTFPSFQQSKGIETEL